MDTQSTSSNSEQFVSNVDVITDDVLEAIMARVPADKLRKFMPARSNIALVNIDRQQLYRKRRQFASYIQKATALLDDMRESGVVISPMSRAYFESCIKDLADYDMNSIPTTGQQKRRIK